VVSALESASDLLVSEWNQLASAGGFYLSHAWLRLQEDDPDSPRRYLVARRHGRLLGVLAVDDVERENNDFYLFSAVLPEDHESPTRPVTLLGGHGGYGSGLLLDPRLSRAETEDTAHALVTRAAEDAERGGRAAVFFYLQEQYRELVGGVPGVGEPLLARHDAIIELAGHRWDDYLTALPTGHRTKVRREVRRFGEAGYSLTVGPLTPWLPAAGEMLAAVQQRYGHDADPGGMADMLAEQIEAAEAHVSFVASDEQGPVGFALAFPFGDTLNMRAGGFAYARLRKGAAEYFNLAYYEPVRWAYRQGLSRLHLGIESLEAKHNRGARLSPLWVVPVGWSWPNSDAIRCASRQRAADPVHW
jgi:uncharacterized protein